MVIQRWQSVFLLLAVFSMLFVIFRPFGIIPATAPEQLDTQLISFDYPLFLILNILTVLLLFIDIFLYRNLRLQKMVAAISIIMIIAAAGTVGVILAATDTWVLEWAGAPVGIVCALICTIIARHRMTCDENLLKSYDRLR